MEKVMIRYIHQRSISLTRYLKIKCFNQTNIKIISCKRYQSQPWRYFDFGEENTMQMFQLKFRKPLQIYIYKKKSMSPLKRWVAFLPFKKLNLYLGFFFFRKQVNTPVRILAIFLLPTQKPPSRACALSLTWWSLACLTAAFFLSQWTGECLPSAFPPSDTCAQRFSSPPVTQPILINKAQIIQGAIFWFYRPWTIFFITYIKFTVIRFRGKEGNDNELRVKVFGEKIGVYDSCFLIELNE